MIELFFVVVILGVICIDHRLYRLQKTNREMLEHLRDIRDAWTGSRHG